MFVIAVASRIEMRCIEKRIEMTGPERTYGSMCRPGTLCGRRVLLVKTGVGLKKAGSAARQIVKCCRADRVLSIGAAGALDPSLNRDDIVIADTVLEGSGQRYQCDDEVCRQAYAVLDESGFRVLHGDCFSAGRFIHATGEKKSIYAACGALVVDMESAALAKVFCRAGLRFFDVRIVSDTARSVAVDAGAIAAHKKKFGPIGPYVYFLKKPGDFLRALRFGIHIRRTGKIIADVAETLAATPGFLP